MKQFAFIHKQDNTTIMGSDQLINIDGRFNIFNAIHYAKGQAKRLKNVRSDVYSIRVYTGSISKPIAISGYHQIN